MVDARGNRPFDAHSAGWFPVGSQKSELCPWELVTAVGGLVLRPPGTEHSADPIADVAQRGIEVL